MFHNGQSALMIGYSVTLIILSSFLVILRLISRRLSTAGFWWDDALITLSLLGSYPFYVGVMLMVHHGMGRHLNNLSLRDLVILLKVIYAGNFPYLLIISMTKNSILLFYLRLFGTPGTHRGFKKLVHVTQALVVIWLIASLIPGTLRCHPIDDMWHPLVVEDPEVRHYCINDGAYYIASSAFNVALDFWILVLPLPIIWNLQLSKNRKIGLMVIFLLGSFICGASIARAYTVAIVPFSDFSYAIAPSIIWSSVELSVGIICACLPTTQPVLKLLSKRIRDVLSHQRITPESNERWYSGIVGRGTQQKDNGGGVGKYGLADEELATLRPIHSRTKSVTETYEMYYSARSIRHHKKNFVAAIPSVD